MQSPDKIVIKFLPFSQSKIRMKRLSSKNISSIERGLEVKIFPWLWVSYFTRYTTFKNHKIFQKSGKMGGKMGQIVSQMGQVEFHEEQQ